MDKELALRLREAGFPQKRKGERLEVCLSDIEKYGEDYKRVQFIEYGVDNLEDLKDKFLHHPTLEELIEACKKVSLKRKEGEGDGYVALAGTFGGWEAGYLRHHAYEGSWFDWQYFGKTPTEAVANLWLALNEPVDNTSSLS